jgi:hypothetical protein
MQSYHNVTWVSAFLLLVWTTADDYICGMCGRVIQSSEPLRYAIVDGINVRDSRVHNYPPRWNAAPSQELLVIRRNQTRIPSLMWTLANAAQSRGQTFVPVGPRQIVRLCRH